MTLALHTRPQQLADALYAVAEADHYMVGIVEPVTRDELDDAEQILIARQNAAKLASREFSVCDLALDIVEQMQRCQS
jgi:hypothetical protein